MKIDGVGSVTIADHNGDVPFVVKYLPELLSWFGNGDGSGNTEMANVYSFNNIRPLYHLFKVWSG